MAGGTAAALRLGHRISEDLDLFSERPFEPERLVLEVPGFRATSAGRGTLHGTLADVRVSLLYYPPALLYPAEEIDGLRVASLRDVATMKLAALAGRGRRRDFVDVYFLAKAAGPIEALIADFDRRFAGAYSRYHLVRSLGYFDDAERDPQPRMIAEADWEAIKRFFESEQRRIFSQSAT